MAETTKSIANQQIQDAAEVPSNPKGIGMAVAFDWGLAVQILITPFASALFGAPSYLKQLNLNPTLTTVVSTVAALPIAALIALFGEGIRRGWRWTRPWQVGVNALGFVGGLASLVSVWKGAQEGNYWPLVTSVILVIFSPLIAWRLSRPETAAWFKTVKSEEARKRHGGMWVVFIALWAIAGGVLQTLATLKR